MSAVEDRFVGQIAGVGSSSGTRLVVGRWARSPWGAFADVMVQTATGHRVLLAPSERVADYVAATYTFDEVRVEPITLDARGRQWVLSSPSLSLTISVGGRMPLAHLVRVVPRAVATHPTWARVVSPIAGLVMPGVRTAGTAGQRRREFYGATDLHDITAISGSWEGTDLGSLTPVDPTCEFGFSSTPRRPMVTDVVTTIRR